MSSRPGGHREHDAPGSGGEHDGGQPLALRDPGGKPAPGQPPTALSRTIRSHATTVTSASVRRIVPEDDTATSLVASAQIGRGSWLPDEDSHALHPPRRPSANLAGPLMTETKSLHQLVAIPLPVGSRAL